MKGKFKKKLIWCSHCDADMVAPGAKCNSCGKREFGSKVKKPNQHEILRNNFSEA